MSDLVPRSNLSGAVRMIDEMHAEQGRRLRATQDAQIALPSLLSGKAMFDALRHAVADAVAKAPPDCDVLIVSGRTFITEARFIEPHTFILEGFNDEGERIHVVGHFTQLMVQIIYRPKGSEEPIFSRVIQGFAPQQPQP